MRTSQVRNRNAGRWADAEHPRALPGTATADGGGTCLSGRDARPTVSGNGDGTGRTWSGLCNRGTPYLITATMWNGRPLGSEEFVVELEKRLGRELRSRRPRRKRKEE